ncbi:Hypothetical predicted protein [Cloeon dipterum]|uniref:Uncharacterized protein n=1 Tax=Cloeon dipterum TaxID=197152 RepID=A0A8S1DA48_9INSE|nr:Hypothetical predicted protein [Cloeon dipterum]
MSRERVREGRGACLQYTACPTFIFQVSPFECGLVSRVLLAPANSLIILWWLLLLGACVVWSLSACGRARR